MVAMVTLLGYDGILPLLLFSFIIVRILSFFLFFRFATFYNIFVMYS